MPLNNSNVNNTTFVAESSSRLSPAISIRTPPPPLSLTTSSLINNLINTITTTTTGPMPVPRTSPNNNNGVVSSATIQSTQHNVRTAGHLSLSRESSGVLGSSSGVLGSTSGQLVSSADVAASAAAAASNKILGRNVNGTLVMTSAPSNEAELQLYRVMQRASLLAYYDTLLEMGGDDVQQLCEAGEEEFLEIMALVGMASKPLHVRRLQKALQEWVNNPAMFQAPILPGGLSTTAGSSPVFPSSTSQSSSHEVHSSTPRAINLSASQHVLPPPISQSPAPPLVSPGQMPNLTRPSPPSANGACSHISSRHGSPSPGLQLAMKDSGNSGGSTGCGSSGGAPSPGLPLHVHGADSLSPGSPPPLQLTPTLAEAQIQRLAESAKQLSASLPSLEPKPQNSKKRICKDLEYVMAMADDDPRRMDEIRKYAAIYGRFDCKRKPEKPLTLHEVSVNEAAAQICRLVPALLTRRDELFPLARQVVRDSGYQYSKAHANEFAPHSLGCPGFTARAHNGDDVSSSSAAKRMRLLDPNEMHADIRRQERLEQISEELRGVAERQEELRQLATGGASEAAAWQSQLEALQSRQAQLAVEQAELGRHSASHKHSRSYRRSARISAASYGDAERPDTDDTDSQFSYSNASSPSQDVGDSRDSTTREGDSTTVPTGESINTVRTSSINKSPNKLLSKQSCLSVLCPPQPAFEEEALFTKLVQETLLGEGLRVVKEMVASQERRDLARDDETPPPAHVTSSARSQHPLLHHYDAFFQHHNKVQVISASGGNIIAVANPALSMSPAIHAADSAEVKVNSGSPRPPSASPHPMAALFKQEPLSPCKSE